MVCRAFYSRKGDGPPKRKLVLHRLPFFQIQKRNSVLSEKRTDSSTIQGLWVPWLQESDALKIPSAVFFARRCAYGYDDSPGNSWTKGCSTKTTPCVRLPASACDTGKSDSWFQYRFPGIMGKQPTSTCNPRYLPII